MPKSTLTSSPVSTRTKRCTGPGSSSRKNVPAPEIGHWLAGRTAIVTGASRGIGRATAIAMARAAAHVVIVARDAEGLERTCDVIHQGGGRAVGVTADVSHSDDVDRIFQAAAAIGPPTALVCAAAVLQRM